MTLHQIFFAWSQWLWLLLANHLWQTTLIALVAWAVIMSLKRATARARYLIWMIAFLKFLAPSALLIVALESSGFDLMERSTYTSVEIFFQIAQPISLAGSEAITIGESSVMASPEALAEHTGHGEFYCLLTFIWFCGTAIWCLRWLMHRRRFARALKAGSEMTGGPAAVALQRAKMWLSLTREIALVESPLVCEPGVWRTWRPVVVLPKGLADKLSAEELEALMMHELIHVLRLDNLLDTMQMLVCCLFWFHPLVWLIDRRLLDERELVCDEDVIRYIGEPRVYADGLWKVAQFGLGWSLAGVSRAAGSNLKRRIALMLDGRHRTNLSLAGRAITGSAVAALLVVAFALAIFTRDKVEASKPTASQDPTPAVILPMQFENLPGIPLVVMGLQASLSEARPVKFQGVAPDGQLVDLTHNGEMERDLNLTVNLLNQGDRAVSSIAMQIQNPSFWRGDVSGIMILTGLVENESGHIEIEPQQTFTFNQRERLKERNNGVELMSSIGDFRFKIVGVRFEPDRSWIWAKDVVEKGIVMTKSSRSATSSDVVYTAATDKVAFNGNLSFDGKSYVIYRPMPSPESGERGIDRSAKLMEDPSVVDYINKVGQNLVLASDARRPAQGKGESADIIEPMTANLRPTLLYKEKPRYTDQARQNEVEGTVVLNVVFGADGRMTQIRIVRGLPDGLTEQAITAAQAIRFEPAVKDGQRVSVRGNLEFSFNLDKSANKSTSKQGVPGTFEGIEPMSVWMRPTILYKEKAQYTEEARHNKIEGTVVLNVIFGADGTIGNIEVDRGLPYGLSEQAIAATRVIRFEPALKNGRPVSVRGKLEFTFRLY
jgi:TonB family protein